MKDIKITFSVKIWVIFVILFANFAVKAQTITVTGSNWNVNSNSTPNFTVITEAGTNYTGTYENVNNLTLSGTLPRDFLNLLSGNAAQISIQYTPNTWHNNLKLYAKRIGGSTNISGLCVLCSATLAGGTNYTEILSTGDTQLFTINFIGTLGIGTSVSYSSVNIKLQISGISVTVPVDNYSATIVFTVGAP